MTARQREQRSDAAQNREALVRAAVAAVHREGLRVPMATIAADAGVGVGTLYRHFATREELLDHLTHRSFERVRANAEHAAVAGDTGAEAIRLFVDAAIGQRDELVLPLHGGPAVTAPATLALRDEVHALVRGFLERGRRDGSVLADVTPGEVVVFGAMLAQPQRGNPASDALCRRLLATWVNGLRVGEVAPHLPDITDTA